MDYSNEQLCLAALSLSGTNTPSEMNCEARSTNEYHVSYSRIDDNKQYSFLCKIENNEVRWFHKDIGGWNERNRAYFKQIGNELIFDDYADGKLLRSVKFSLSDFP